MTRRFPGRDEEQGLEKPGRAGGGEKLEGEEEKETHVALTGIRPWSH